MAATEMAVGRVSPVPPKLVDFKPARLRALVVDDDANSRILLQKALCKMGLQVEVAKSGAEATQITWGQGFDLLFLDLQLPDMSGIDVAVRIRRREAARPDRHRLRIVACTGFAMEEDRVMALNAGMDAFFSKPIDIAEIGAYIQKLFSQR